MGVRNLARAALIGTAAMTLASAPASAQLVTFSTYGTFSNGSCGPSLCVFGGYFLSFQGDFSTAWTPPADVSLGDFALTCFGQPCSGGNIISGSTFMLTIVQSGPTAGTGSISGSLGWDPSTGTLSWTPNQGSVTIGGVTYGLTEDGTGCPIPGSSCIDINQPNGNFIPAFTEIHDDVTTTPEPATVALMATGLVGLAPFARRRRQQK
jgi:PEP-CTERM motif